MSAARWTTTSGVVEELFSAARAEFRQLEYFYFHNCLYEGVWKDNRRRHAETIATFDVLHKYGPDYKVIFVGDAAMSPYEIAHPGGSVEHWNAEAGAVWLGRVLAAMAECSMDQPGSTQKHWGLHPFDRHDPRYLWRPHVSADAGRAGRRDEAIFAQALIYRLGG